MKNIIKLTMIVAIASTLFVLNGCKEENTQTGSNQSSQTNSQSSTSNETTKAPVPVVTPPVKPAAPALEIGRKVLVKTSMGDITIGLYESKAPITTANFLAYVQSGFYDGTIFHRVISGFMIQGGGFTPDMNQKPTRAPIVNESTNKVANKRGTIAMARTNVPNSATCQFFINHKDNSSLNYTNASNPGYAVFGEVLKGMDVVDKIASVQTGTKNRMGDVPLQTVLIESVRVIIK